MGYEDDSHQRNQQQHQHRRTGSQSSNVSNSNNNAPMPLDQLLSTPSVDEMDEQGRRDVSMFLLFAYVKNILIFPSNYCTKNVKGDLSSLVAVVQCYSVL